MKHAVGFLLELLSDGEKPSAEVIEQAKKAGISDGTFKRAVCGIIKIKSRKVKNRWYMSLPPDFSYDGTDRLEWNRPTNEMRLPAKLGVISTDWALVDTNGAENTGVSDTVIVPTEMTEKGLHIKVGRYEFTADESFPTDKLVALLRALEVGGC
jgi:hypothetical protein